MRILYCSSTALGRDMQSILYKLDCKVVAAYTGGQPISEWPIYDLGISFLYTHKIPAEQVGVKRWINFHPGPLPEMRGRDLAYHAIVGGMKEFGATVHYMDASYDTGDIIECRRFAIKSCHNAGDLVKISHQMLADMFAQHVPAFVTGSALLCYPQREGTYYHKAAIKDTVELTDEQALLVRAATVAGRYYAKAIINGVTYELTPRGAL